jgi:hypothetical protein
MTFDILLGRICHMQVEGQIMLTVQTQDILLKISECVNRAFGININLDYLGCLSPRALDSFQGLPRKIEAGTRLYLDFRARVLGTPVHSVNRYVGKGPSSYPCRTSVDLQLTGWKYTGLESSYHRIKLLSPLLIYTSYMRPKLITSAEPLVLTLDKKDKVFDLDHLGPSDKVEFSACLDVRDGGHEPFTIHDR